MQEGNVSARVPRTLINVTGFAISRKRNGIFLKLNIMKKEIEIPKGCKKITIEVEGERVIVTYSSSINDREFLCDETGEVEELPKVGDFSIFWDNNEATFAIVANMSGKRPSGKWEASDNCIYDNAIKFRNYEQYLKVRGIYGEE